MMIKQQGWIGIPFNVPSLKNSKQIIQLKSKKGPPRPILIPSKTHKKYAKNTGIIWKAELPWFKAMTLNQLLPLQVGFYFVRDTKRLFDYGNAIATCEDLMTEYGWIPDDNCDELLSVPCGHHVDKANAGVYIRVISEVYIPRPLEFEKSDA
jgi:hypothetical protein